MQIYGEKRWTIYRGRADNPIEHPRYYNVLQAEYDRIKGEIDTQVTMRPGDLLYLPRGQCHDAMALSDTSLHLTFSCALPMGLNLIQDMAERLIDDPLFRADLPRIDAEGGDRALGAHIAALLARLSEIYAGERGLELAKSIVRGFSGGARTGFDLPNLQAKAMRRPSPPPSIPAAVSAKRRTGRQGR